MTIATVRSVTCPCGARITQPCTPHGDHLARYLRAEQAGVISRGLLSTAIATLIVIAPHAIIPATAIEPGPADTERAICMNHVYVHVSTGEPVTRLSRNDPASPFAVIDFGSDWYHTSEDPAWCRRVAAAWTHAAELLEAVTTTEIPCLPNAGET